MSSSFDLPDLDRFTTGTVGPPGQRVFYLQGVSSGHLVTLRLEKAQVAALAEYLAQLLSDLPTPEPHELPDEMDLVEPIVAEWVVGQLGVAVDEVEDRLVLRADEVPTDDEELDPDEIPGGGMARFSLTRPQVAAFIIHAATLVASGRPPCPLCHRPLDADGHMCIKTNGHKSG
ncbi:MAG TPA: DUF3090 domain-containing protein [Acidimicrobiales bacterium]|nr:DUF3090 domain-containing protein [Acidimicrobiales bacterium]